MVFIQVFIRKNRINTASTWSLYRSGHANLAINKKMADDITDTVSTVPKMPEIIFKLVYGYSQLCIMKCVFWYLSYIMSSYKHWNVECVWDNHPFILHLLVVFYILVYWLILDVLMLIVFYTLVYWLIKVSWNGCFDINPILCPRTVVLSLVI